MEKELVTFVDQEIATRLSTRKHFLKDIEDHCIIEIQ
jgi:hypothetical protein